MYELLLFPNSLPKNLGAAYTRTNRTVLHKIRTTEQHFNIFEQDCWHN
jgi:hypothetical protein